MHRVFDTPNGLEKNDRQQVSQKRPFTKHSYINPKGTEAALDVEEGTTYVCGVGEV